MIEFALTYGQLIWLVVVYCISSFLRGVAEGIWQDYKKRKGSHKSSSENLTSNVQRGTLKGPNQNRKPPL